MPGTITPTNAGAIALATLVRTDLANSVLHLFMSNFNPGPTTTKAALEAIECTYDGYAAKTIANFDAVYLAPGSGAAIETHQQFDSVPALGTTNSVYGGWLETAAGDVWQAFTLDAPVAMGLANQSLPLDLTLTYGQTV
jgi:hypothetical protein